ncbi:MAG: caspase family protein, partial [Brachymonas sp.]|nr:caspase family protein [Brachymonas sp.]
MKSVATHPLLKQVTIRSLGLLLAAGTLLPTVAQAPSDVRIALVIGNGAYAGNAALPNPANDAAAMSQTLKGLGFSVVEAR